MRASMMPQIAILDRHHVMSLPYRNEGKSGAVGGMNVGLETWHKLYMRSTLNWFLTRPVPR